MTTAKPETPASETIWYSEHSEAEMRRMYADAHDHDCPELFRGESFETWAEAEGYTRALPASPSAQPVAPEGLQGGHDAPCFFCKKPCDGLAANPGLWPIPLSHPDGTGIVKWHHMACIVDRLFLSPSAEEAARSGWQLVPKEPTSQMIAAAFRYRWEREGDLGGIWELMLAAAPEAMRVKEGK